MGRFLMSFSLLFSLASLISCSPEQFSAIHDPSPISQTNSTPASPGIVPSQGSCTSDNVEAIRRQTKILFVVDTSGSNAASTINSGANGYGGYSVPPTDPQKFFRRGALSDFLNRYSHKTNFNWGFITFAQDSARAVISSGASPTFAADPTAMGYALNVFTGIEDYGDTPYQAAIQMASMAIQTDPDLNSTAKPNYMVILLTDGFPTDYKDVSGAFQAAAIDRDIESLINIAPGQVKLSTIYYGLENDPNAISLLQRLATKGSGQFASVNDPNSGFRIDDVIPGSHVGCAQ
jgi:hypothetical protein